MKAQTVQERAVGAFFQNLCLWVVCGVLAKVDIKLIHVLASEGSSELSDPASNGIFWENHRASRRY